MQCGGERSFPGREAHAWRQNILRLSYGMIEQPLPTGRLFGAAQPHLSSVLPEGLGRAMTMDEGSICVSPVRPRPPLLRWPATGTEETAAVQPSEAQACNLWGMLTPTMHSTLFSWLAISPPKQNRLPHPPVGVGNSSPLLSDSDHSRTLRRAAAAVGCRLLAPGPGRRLVTKCSSTAGPAEELLAAGRRSSACPAGRRVGLCPALATLAGEASPCPAGSHSPPGLGSGASRPEKVAAAGSTARPSA